MPAEDGGQASGAANAGDGEAIWKKHKDAFESKDLSKYYDPCQEAADRSHRCMYRNAGDRDLCQDYFQAYRDCKKAWTTARYEANKKKSQQSLFFK